jgi:hypothetical protein
MGGRAAMVDMLSGRYNTRGSGGKNVIFSNMQSFRAIF